jgi:hypothetical protein
MKPSRLGDNRKERRGELPDKRNPDVAPLRSFQKEERLAGCANAHA